MFDNVPNVLQTRKGRQVARAGGVEQGTLALYAGPADRRRSRFAGFDVSVWFGVSRPRARPSSGSQLNGEINRILKLPEVVALFHKQGVEPLGGTPDASPRFCAIRPPNGRKL